MTPENILAELFYKAKDDDLDPVLWRIHRRRLPILLRDLSPVRGYVLTSNPASNTREIFGIVVYAEDDRPRLPPNANSSAYAEPPPNYYCLECLEPTRRRTVYREWVDGKFI